MSFIILNAPIGYLSIQFNSGADGSKTVTLVMKEVVMFGAPFDFGVIFTKSGDKGAKWGSFIYAGIDKKKSGDVKLDLGADAGDLQGAVDSASSALKDVAKFGRDTLAAYSACHVKM